MPYEVMLSPRARRVLDRLSPSERDAVLVALEHDLDTREAIAERIEADGRTYLHAPLVPRHHVLYRPLSDDEVRRLIDEGVLTEQAHHGYAVLSLDRPGRKVAR